MLERRSHHIGIAVCALLSAGAGISHARVQDGLGANGPIELTLDAAGEHQAESVPPSTMDLAAPQLAQAVLMRNISLLNKPQESGALIPSAANEAKQLGKPTASEVARSLDSRDDESGVAGALGDGKSEVTRVVGALAAVIGLIVIVRKVLRRTGALGGGGSRPSGVLEILARYPVGRGQQLILLKLARRVVLLHQSGSNMIALSEMSEPDEVAALLSRLEAGAGERGAARFRNTLSEFMAQHHADRLNSPCLSSNEFSTIDAEVVDLTRGQSRGLLAILRRGSLR